jgi:hypothetical protein
MFTDAGLARSRMRVLYNECSSFTDFINKRWSGADAVYPYRIKLEVERWLEKELNADEVHISMSRISAQWVRTWYELKVMDAIGGWLQEFINALDKYKWNVVLTKDDAIKLANQAYETVKQNMKMEAQQ